MAEIERTLWGSTAQVKDSPLEREHSIFHARKGNSNMNWCSGSSKEDAIYTGQS